jgi:hypothetical protein
LPFGSHDGRQPITTLSEAVQQEWCHSGTHLFQQILVVLDSGRARRGSGNKSPASPHSILIPNSQQLALYAASELTNAVVNDFKVSSWPFTFTQWAARREKGPLWLIWQKWVQWVNLYSLKLFFVFFVKIHLKRGKTWLKSSFR